ncbi:unnamed protein product [Rotaria magnacalcarata]|uniref:Uncharacterized protein n=1 Tax=Rotaria magnacalcarata TaxID=392030 RepID=A0A816TJ71_9BILA|nr:unnamed protein product [Rotaria magnacalcarata]
MDASSSNTSVYQLHDQYSLRVISNSSPFLIVELYSNELLSRSVSLNDNQCFVLSHRLCETTYELYELLIDLLQTSTSSIHVTIDEHLEVSFPIRFGSQNRTKLWSFKIVFPSASSTKTDLIDEVSLDPLDWNETRALGHQIMDDMVDYLRDVRLRPTWRPMPTSVKETIANNQLPLKSQPASEVYDEVRSIALPYALGNIHPHYWGYVHGTGSPIGALAELITGTMNTMSWGGHQASIYLERQVLSWLKGLMGFPNDETSSGVLVSGTSVGTIISLAVARKKFHGRNMIIYYSKEAHSCVIRAANLLGITAENLVLIPTNEQRQIDLQALQSSIDHNSGGFIVGSAGTVGTGAIDDLQGLADLCASRPNDLWFHVDGAIGAVLRCSTRFRSLLTGLERADSIAFDLHKWLFVPYECGCILVRDAQLHRSAFAQPQASYLALMEGGITPKNGEIFFGDYSLELSRNMKALKVWMTLKTYGVEKLGQIMEQNVEQAKYFGSLIQKNAKEFELLANVTLNIVCFRYIGLPHLHDSDREDILNKFNQRLLVMIQERGVAVVSPYSINKNSFALRMCITNHRTKLFDMDRFLEETIKLAHELLDTNDFKSVTKT